MASDQPTMTSAADESFLSQVIRGVSKDNNAHLLAKISEITPAHVREAMTKYLVPVFEPKTTNLVITCATIMADAAAENFRKAGFEPAIKPVDHFQDDYGLLAPEGDDEPDEDEDEDEDEEDADEEMDDTDVE